MSNIKFASRESRRQIIRKRQERKMLLSQSINLKQKQSMIMTPRLQQAIRMLQMTNMDLATYLSDLALDNPFLDVEEDGKAIKETQNDAPIDTPASLDKAMAEGQSQTDDPTANEDFDNRFDQTASEAHNIDFSVAGRDNDWDMIGSAIAEKPDSLYTHIDKQIELRITNTRQKFIARQFLEALEPSGWLRKTVDDIIQDCGCKADEGHDVLAILQSFEPTGIFATGLADCLRLQLPEHNLDTPQMHILLDHLPELGDGKIAMIARKCGIEQEVLFDLINDMRRLNPKPGAIFSDDDHPVSPPDLVVRKEKEGWAVELNQSTLPAVTINMDYAKSLPMRAAGEKEYVNQALSSARWLRRAMEQRNSTTLKIAVEIIRQQSDFLEYGLDHLKPLLLRDIAEAVGMHESTVSRVTTGLLMTTPRGSFTLKSFFSVSLDANGDEAGTSAGAVRNMIKDIVEQEIPSAPLSDEAIADLVSERGVKLARRTVAKYRKMLKIPSSSERRRNARLRLVS